MERLLTQTRDDQPAPAYEAPADRIVEKQAWLLLMAGNTRRPQLSKQTES